MSQQLAKPPQAQMDSIEKELQRLDDHIEMAKYNYDLATRIFGDNTWRGSSAQRSTAKINILMFKKKLKGLREERKQLMSDH